LIEQLFNELRLDMGRNPENNKRMLETRNAQILGVAVELFARRGLSATRIKDVAELAGISQGLVYHYYKSKEDIFIALIGNAFQSMNGALETLEQLRIPPKTRFAVQWMRFFKDSKTTRKPPGIILIIAHAGISEVIPDEAKRILKTESRKPYEVMARIIRDGQNDGTIATGDAEQLAMVFWTLIKGLALHISVHGDSFTMAEPEIIMKIFA
jgi:AcrR family transcriptional regulator